MNTLTWWMGEIFSGLSININDLLHLLRTLNDVFVKDVQKGENYCEILFLSSIDNHKRTQNLFEFEYPTDITIKNENKLITKPFLNTFQPL